MPLITLSLLKSNRSSSPRNPPKNQAAVAPRGRQPQRGHVAARNPHGDAREIAEGAGNLGLVAENIPVTQENILAALQSGTPLICSMYPGDFTYTGHFIVLTGIDENGAITVNDPNSPANTKKHWSMTEILPQIRQTWGYRT